MQIIPMNPNETSEEYFIRICSNKENYLLSWANIAQLMNNITGEVNTGNKYRKQFRRIEKSGILQNAELPQDNSTLSESEKLQRLKVRLTDERTQNNAYIRRLSREDTIKEIAHDAILEICKSGKTLPKFQTSKLNNPIGNDGILLVSDWHYGVEISNHWNTYNCDICRGRVWALTNETIRLCKENNISTLYVLNLGDLIAGRIKTQIRIESSIDTITQIMQVTDLLARMLEQISKVVQIEYYDCADNHSRIDPNKKESLQLETLTRITWWYLQEYFKNSNQIHINENDIADDIISFKSKYWQFGGVHGDKDKLADAVSNVSLLTRKQYDAIFTAHGHHFAGDETNTCLVIANPSLIGVDEYAETLRASSVPRQLFMVSTEKQPIEIIYPISFK